MAMRRQFSEMTRCASEPADDDDQEGSDRDELDHAFGGGDEDAHGGTGQVNEAPTRRVK